MKIYGIHKGCKFEGGGSLNVFFKSRENARSFMREIVEEENKRIEQHNERLKEDGCELFCYYEKKEDDRYETDCDIIYVFEANLKE